MSDLAKNIAAAERAVVEAGLARYEGVERHAPHPEFFALCNAFNAACRELLHLRAAQASQGSGE